MSSAFRHRSESALIHPATATAIVVLLLNDMAFKAIWLHSWVTGKLSDLAWVAFASPLLAFLLWLHLGISLTLGRVAAMVLVTLASLVLAGYLKRKPQPD